MGGKSCPAIDIPWFETDRYPTILSELQLVHAELKTERELMEIERKLRNFSPCEPFIDKKSYAWWDEYLKFVGVTELTKANNLISFLAEQKSNPVVIDLDFVPPLNLAELLLLVLAQSEGLSVIGKERMLGILKLSELGFDIRSSGDAFFLATPVKFIFPSKLPIWNLRLHYLSEPVLEFLMSQLIEVIELSATEESGQAYITLDIKNLFRKVKEADGFSTVFAATALSQNWDGSSNSSIEIWRDLSLWHPEGSSFHDEIREICKSGSTSHPSAEIRLTSDQFSSKDGLDVFQVADGCPHFYIMLMVLLDRDQSNITPILQDHRWMFAGVELLTAIDDILTFLGYSVWSEWYSYDTERRRNITNQLVGLLQEMNIATISFNQLEVTQYFSVLLQTDYAILSNQTKFVRQRIRSAIQMIH